MHFLSELKTGQEVNAPKQTVNITKLQSFSCNSLRNVPQNIASYCFLIGGICSITFVHKIVLDYHIHIGGKSKIIK